MTATWCEIAATSLVLCSRSLSRYRFGVVAVLWLFLRRRDPGAVTVPVTDSVLNLRSTPPNRWVGFLARAFWRTPCTDRSCSLWTVTCVRHSSMHRRSPLPWLRSGRTVGTVCRSWRAASGGIGLRAYSPGDTRPGMGPARWSPSSPRLTARSNLTFAFDANPYGSFRRARSLASSSFTSCLTSSG